MTDIAALVAENLDIWTGAIERKSGAGRGGGGKRISLYGIERLHALILDLAVQGKLVPQDAGDEPASRLLDRITAERKALQQAGKISKPKNLPPIGVDELSVPHTWVATRFGAIFSLEYGDNLPEAKRTGSGEYNVFGSNGVVGTHDSFMVDEPCLVVGRKGSAGAINKSQSPCWVTDVAYYCVPPTGIDLDFQYILFRTLGLDELGKGIKPGLNRNEANVLVVLLPPLAEQRRIVAKVDELMALCDALERESARAMAAHQTLVEELLATLVNSADATDLAANWARLETHFDTLFNTDVSIEALKQTILDLAVRGKLVEQDKEDETAQNMLARANHAPNKGKKVKSHPPIKAADHPFPLPSNWHWERFDNLIQSDAPIAYGVLVPGDDQPDGVPFVRIADLSITDPPALPEKAISPSIDAQYERTRIKGGEILMGVVGSIGKLGVAPESWAGANIARAICRIVPAPFMDKHFVLWLLQSRFMQDSFRGDTRTLAQPTLNLTLIRLAATPIPPIAEQRRIVAKVDELMGLCDALKARLADATETRRNLADAIVERAAA